MATSRLISDQEIEDGLELLAELIDRYGDVYWPLFDRLERELEERRSKAVRLSARLKFDYKTSLFANKPQSRAD